MNLNNISIILIQPQMGENIGAAARVMKNFGLKDLRIVSPRDGWPNSKAHDMSANADDIIESAKIFNTTQDALSDLQMVFATASKSRDMVKPVITPENAASLLKNAKIGFMFGKESSGLNNDDISYANHLISIPTAGEYDSLNLAQAVCVVCYEIFKSKNNLNAKSITEASSDLSSRSDINEMMNFLDKELTEKNFFQVPEKKPGMLVNIRNIFTRNFYTEQEIRTLRGIFNALKK